MRYDVDQNAIETAMALWKVHGENRYRLRLQPPAGEGEANENGAATNCSK